MRSFSLWEKKMDREALQETIPAEKWKHFFCGDFRVLSDRALCAVEVGSGDLLPGNSIPVSKRFGKQACYDMDIHVKIQESGKYYSYREPLA